MAIELGINIMQSVLAVLTLIFGLLFARFFSSFIADLMKTERLKKFLQRWDIEEPEVDFMAMILRYFLYAFTCLLAIAQFTFGMAFIQLFAVIFIVVLFLIIVYSMREFIPNTAAGLYIKRNKILKTGNSVFIDGFKGQVKDIDLLSTTIETEDGRVVIIPNSIITRRKIIKTADAEKEER
jgi:small conductance mechanosensitive channel